jgi:putative hydrolase of the HAD superfamily
VIRYEQLKEVTNAVWVSEALNAVGYKVEADDSRIRAALNVFFKDYVDSLELRLGAKKLIKKATEHGKVGLISNFTYAPVVYSSLRQLGIGNFFNAVTVSDANGWRKPSKHIFHDTLNKLQLKPSQAVYVGDSPIEDIKGAKDAGLKTVFIQSQFYRLDDLLVSKQKPEFVFEDLEEILARFEEIVGC